jgi:hypothetical protein
VPIGRQVLTAFAAVPLLLLAACTGDNGAATSTPAPPTATSDGAPLTATPGATTPVPDNPTPGATVETGIAVVDGVIEAVTEQDAAALAALMLAQQVPCSAQSPLGGARPGGCDTTSPDEVVPVFPQAGCELEIDEGDVDAIAERTLPSLGELFAVVQFSENVFGPDPYYPRGSEYGVIFAGATVGSAVPTAHLLVIYDAAVVYHDSACGGGHEEFVGPTSAPPYRSAEVIARGPAFED